MVHLAISPLSKPLWCCGRSGLLECVLRPEGIIQKLGNCPRAGRWEGIRQKASFVKGLRAGMRVHLREERRDLGTQTRAVGEQHRERYALLADGAPPAGATPYRLIAPLEQVHDEHLEATLQFASVPLAHSVTVLESQGGTVGPELVIEDLRWGKGAVLREGIQPRVLQDFLARLGVPFRQQHRDLGL